ncbi:O-methyltransferase [Pseudomonas syringae pv. aptata]|uniref:O-methyltransferase n=1 Tax=Pseudomonas syringae TaxID=317 RepID=UPI003F88C123
MASFEAINYSLRPNKCVERKIIFETLMGLSSNFDFTRYQYLGMGSMWFVDFILAHKNLGIEELVSFELEEHSPRAIFNRPYSNIRIFPGPVAEGIATIDWTKPAIVWLDYDCGPENSAVFDDSAEVSSKIASGSILMVTVNAHMGRIPAQNAEGEKLTRHQGLAQILGDAAPSEQEFQHINIKNYHNVLATCLTRHIVRAHRRSGRGGKFVSFLNYYYKDNAPMITVGGMFVDENNEESLTTNKCYLSSEYIGPALYPIQVPPLTYRERISLDALLPSAHQLNEDEILRKLGFKLAQTQLDDYAKFYKLYPSYSEVVL